MKQEWYAISASVAKEFRSENKFTSISKPMAIKATSEEEACGIAIKEMYKLFPVEDGWYNHQALAVKVPVS